MNASRLVLVTGLLFVALLGAPGHAAAFCVIAEPPSPIPTQVNGTQVEIQLTEGFARVVIIKEFYNPSDESKQGQIVFPLEKGHELITDLRLKIGNVVYNSSAQNRSDALGSFLEAIAKGQDAALVQYDPPRDVYWIAVTIPPKEARTTITTLEMPLTKTDGFYEYGYRLSVDARDSLSYLLVHVHVETAAALDEVRIPSHPSVPVVRNGSHAADVYLDDAKAPFSGDLHIQFRAAGASLSQFAEPNGDRYVRFSLDAADAAFASAQPTPRSLLMLVDASGSMGRAVRWTIAKDAARKLVSELRDGDSFNVAVFQGATVAPFSSRLMGRTPSVEADLARFLDTIRPHGSTALTAPLAQAALWAAEARSLGQQPILVLVSDGRPTRSSTDLELEQAYSRISVDHEMPVFAMAVQPTDHADESVLYNLSHFHHGDLVTLHDEVPTAVADLLSAIRVPVQLGLRADIPDATGLVFASANPQKVWEGGEALVIARMRGTVNDSLTLRLAWPDPSGAPDGFEVRSVGPEIPVQSLLKRQWVLTRVHALLEGLRGREDLTARDELIALATANRIATPYTSLLVLLPQPNPDGGRSAPESSLLGDPFSGLDGELLAAPSSGLSRSPIFLAPLEAEARKADAFRRDFANPLIAEDEVDRFVALGSADYSNLDLSGAVSRFEGTYVRVFEVSGELVGVTRPFRDVSGWLVNGFGFVGIVLTVVALCRLSRKRVGRIDAGASEHLDSRHTLRESDNGRPVLHAGGGGPGSARCLELTRGRKR